MMNHCVYIYMYMLTCNHVKWPFSSGLAANLPRYLWNLLELHFYKTDALADAKPTVQYTDST